MQTPKTRSGCLEIPQRTSATPRAARQLKTTASESETASSTHLTTRTDRSPKVVERRSPRSPISEKKRPTRAAEYESQIALLQDDLQKAKDMVAFGESCQRKAQQESDEAKIQLAAMAARLDDTQRQLLEVSISEEARVLELRKLSQDRDRAWQSEIEAIQNKQSVDSAALASAMNDIQRLRLQLVLVSESEEAQTKLAEAARAEFQALKLDMDETLALVKDLETQLRECKESEGKAQAISKETLLDLEKAKASIEILRSDRLKVMDSLGSVTAELEESKAQVNSFQEVVSKLQADLVQANSRLTMDLEHDESSQANGESRKLQVELDSLKLEMEQLKSALEMAEVRYQQEQVQRSIEVQSAYESVERMKQEWSRRELNLVEEVEKSKATIAELKANLMDKETELQCISQENDGIKLEMEKRESERNQANAASGVMVANAVAAAEAAKAREQEALAKLGSMSMEADQCSRRAAQVAEQLEAAQAENSEMEAELRRIRVQSDQWRKAAEAAAAVLSTANNGNLVDTEYPPPYAYDEDEDSPKKRSNVLKKFGDLWKKGQK